jgi:hypothetical protein
MARRKDKNTNDLPADPMVPGEDFSHKSPKIEDLTEKEIIMRKDEAVKAVLRYRKEYDMNRAFLSGHQWIKWHDKDRAFVPWKRKGGRYQATVNVMDSLASTIVAKLMKQGIVFEVPADQANDYAIQGSLIAESVLRAKVTDAHWDSRREDLYWATITGGTTVVEVSWDTSRNTYGDMATGDTRETILPITEFALEPGAKTPEDARWWIKQQVLPAEQVQAMFKLEKKPNEDMSFGGPYTGGVMGQTGPTGRGVEVTWYYERPNFLRPQGAMAVIVNNKLAWGVKPWSFPFKDRLNIDVARMTPVPGTPYGETPLSKIRSLQIQYNFIHSNIQEHIKKVGTAKFAAPYGSSEVFDQMDDDPGNPLRYPDNAQAPHYMVPPGMPGYIIQHLDTLERKMQDIMGVHAISQGVTPSNIESGVGLSILAEQDSTPAGRLAQEAARCLSGMGSKVLQLCAANVKDTRKATVYEDKNSTGRRIKWTGKSLAGQTNAIIPPDSVLPRSHAAAQQFAETIAKMGFIPPTPEGLTLLLELAQVPDREQSLWYVNPNEAKARWDVGKLAGGEVALPRDFQNHKTFIDVGNRFRLTPEYDALPEEQQKIIDNWILAHQRMDEEEAGQQMAKAAMSPALAGTATANAAAPLPPEMTGIMPPAPGTMPQGTPPQMAGAPTDQLQQGVQ